MKIPLNIILYRLSADSIYETQNIDLSQGYNGVKLFSSDNYAADNYSNYLYIISPDILQEPAFKETPDSFLCICSEAKPDMNFVSKNISLVLLFTNESFSSVFNRTLDIFHDFNDWDKEFHLSLLNKAPLQTLLNLSRTYLVHPMVVLDRNYSLLGFMKVPGCVDPIMESILSEGYVTPEIMTRLRQDGLISTSETGDNPLINYYCLTTEKCYYSMMYRFYSNDHIVGYALIFQCNVHPKTNFLYLMNLVAENIRLYFQQERYSSRSSSDMCESLLPEIMEHPETPEKQYADQISYIPGLEMKGHFLLAHVDYNNRSELPFSFVCWSLRNSIPDLKPFVYRNILYVLRMLAEEDNFDCFLSPDEEEIFKRSFRGCISVCGISGTFFTLLDLPMAAKQCQEAIQLGTEVMGNGHIFYRFSDVHTHYLLKELKHTLPMQMIFSPCYTVLKQYDKEHNTDLCYVFMQYLTHGRNINQTSAAIFLHRNTVMNKVKKAISVMHNEFEDTQTLMAFILSYLNDHM